MSLNAHPDIPDHGMTEAKLGETIRRLRMAARLSLRSLAEKSGFSASFLSQVENGQASPSIASMERIATALGVTMGQFFSPPAAALADVELVRARSRVTLTSEWSKARIESLGAQHHDVRLEPVLVTLAPGGASARRPYSSSRDEFALVLEGTVVLAVQHGNASGDPERRHILERGDAVTIGSGIGRRWENVSPAPVTILMVSA